MPVKFGLTAEFSFQRLAFEESSRTLELRPIIEGNVGPLQIDVNPSVETALDGQRGNKGWSFEPSVRFGLNRWGRINPAVEYFGALGSVSGALPTEKEVHQIYPGFDWKVARRLQWNFGVGVGMTPAGNRLVYKTILQFKLGQRTDQHP